MFGGIRTRRLCTSSHYRPSPSFAAFILSRPPLVNSQLAIPPSLRLTRSTNKPTCLTGPIPLKSSRMLVSLLPYFMIFFCYLLINVPSFTLRTLMIGLAYSLGCVCWRSCSPNAHTRVYAMTTRRVPENELGTTGPVDLGDHQSAPIRLERHLAQGKFLSSPKLQFS